MNVTEEEIGTNTTSPFIEALVAAVCAEKKFQEEAVLYAEAKDKFNTALENEISVSDKFSSRKSLSMAGLAEKLREDAHKAREQHTNIIDPTTYNEDESGNHDYLLCNALCLDSQAETFEAQLVVDEYKTRVDSVRKMYDYTCSGVLNALLVQAREDTEAKRVNANTLESMLAQIIALQTRVTILEEEKDIRAV
jgi:hypothetical protein